MSDETNLADLLALNLHNFEEEVSGMCTRIDNPFTCIFTSVYM